MVRPVVNSFLCNRKLKKSIFSRTDGKYFYLYYTHIFMTLLLHMIMTLLPHIPAAHVFLLLHMFLHTCFFCHTCLPHISSNCNLTSCDSTCCNLSGHFSALRNKNWSKNRLVWFEQFHFLCWAVAISKKVLTNCDSSYPNLSIWPFDPLAGEKLIKKYMRFFCNFN
jgi:hypothetical protein